MNLDLKGQHENFVRIDFEGKRSIVATLLENIRETNKLFNDLYNLVVSDIATEEDFYDIFDSIIIVLYRDEKVAERAAFDKLGNIKIRLEEQKKKEIAEKKEGKKEAEELLAITM